MPTESKIPCLLLLFLREQNIESILEQCARSGISKFYFAIDGPRNETDMLTQHELIEKLSLSCDRLRIPFHISLLNKNRGILVNMVTALEFFFSEEEFGIILEDDIIPSSEFVDFVKSMRSTLIQNKDAMLISGWRGFNVDKDLGSFSQLSSYPLIWGWATSRDKWQIMRRWFFEESTTETPTRDHFDPSYGFWKTGFRRVVQGRLDSWANILAFNFALQGYRSIVPSCSLVENVGYDQFATHSIKKRRFIKCTQHPSNLILDKWLETEVYGISKRHALAPVYGPIVDMFKGRPKRIPPLEFLRNLAIQAEGPRQLRDLL